MKLRILTLCVVISLLLLSAWSNAFAVEPEAIVVIPETPPAENSENIYEKLKKVEFWFFVFGCGAISILVKIVDHTIQTNKIENKQGLKELFLKWPLWLGWFLSASIVGLLAFLVGLFQASAVTAVTIGVGWPTVFAQLKEKYGSRTENEEVDKKQPDRVPSLPPVPSPQQNEDKDGKKAT